MSERASIARRRWHRRGCAAVLALTIPLAARGAEGPVGTDAESAPPTIEAMVDYLRATPQGRNPGALAAQKDRLLARRVAEPACAPGLLRALCGVMEDSEADLIARVYIAQYLSLLIPKARTLNPGSEAEVEAALAALYRAATAKDPLLAATALLQLGELHRQDPRLDASLVKRIALDYLDNPATPPAPTISALQVCALLGFEESLPHAWTRLAAKRSAGEQASAYWAIGTLGGHGDLERLKADSQYSIAAAREKAVRQLEYRLKKSPVGEEA